MLDRFAMAVTALTESTTVVDAIWVVAQGSTRRGRSWRRRHRRRRSCAEVGETGDKLLRILECGSQGISKFVDGTGSASVRASAGGGRWRRVRDGSCGRGGGFAAVDEVAMLVALRRIDGRRYSGRAST